MQRAVPIWLVAVAFGLVALVLGVLIYRNFMQTPATYVGEKQEQLLHKRMQEAFGEGKIPSGMKVVPPAPPKGQ